MAQDASNILVSGDAMIHIVFGGMDPLEVPATATALIPATAVELGLTNEEGEKLNRSVDLTTINSHQTMSVRTIASGGSITLEVVALEWNDVSKHFYWGVEAVDGKRTVKADSVVTADMIYDTIDVQSGYEKNVRLIANVTVTPNGSLDFKKTAETGIPLLLTVNGDLTVLD